VKLRRHCFTEDAAEICLVNIASGTDSSTPSTRDDRILHTGSHG
jgi:hypothetical protein